MITFNKYSATTQTNFKIYIFKVHFFLNILYTFLNLYFS